MMALSYPIQSLKVYKRPTISNFFISVGFYDRPDLMETKLVRGWIYKGFGVHKKDIGPMDFPIYVYVITHINTGGKVIQKNEKRACYAVIDLIEGLNHIEKPFEFTKSFKALPDDVRAEIWGMQ